MTYSINCLFSSDIKKQANKQNPQNTVLVHSKAPSVKGHSAIHHPVSMSFILWLFATQNHLYYF